MKTGIMLICLMVCRSKTVFAPRLVSRTTLRIPSGAKQKSSCKKGQHQLCESRPSVRHSLKNLQIHRLEMISHRCSVISPKHLMEKQNLSHCGDDLWSRCSPGEQVHILTAGEAPTADSSTTTSFQGSNQDRCEYEKREIWQIEERKRSFGSEREAANQPRRLFSHSSP